MEDDKKKINQILIAAMEGEVTEQQCELLRMLLSESDEAIQHYVEVASIVSQLRANEFNLKLFFDKKSKEPQEDTAVDLNLWKMLAQQESEQQGAEYMVIPRGRSNQDSFKSRGRWRGGDEHFQSLYAKG